MENKAIEVCNLSKVYKLYDKSIDRIKESLKLTRKKCHTEHYALRNLNFYVNNGETVGIIGTNGSGKSTVLKIITGVLNATTGSVKVNGRISALLELGAGFNMEYTGLENVYLNGMMLGFTREEIDKKINDILEFADIGDFINQPVKTYSSGMFVRLAFAVAINIEPEILIVDEALSVGDIFFQAKCYRKFQEFKKMGKTILFVSHDLGSVNKYCDRVILLNKGKIVMEGKPKEVIDVYKKILVSNNKRQQVVSNSKQSSNEKMELWSKNIETNPNVISYGNEMATIIDFAILDKNEDITTKIEKFQKFKIKMRVKFNIDIKDPIFAFTIKDLRGTEITGTNSLFEKEIIDLVPEGDIRTITFEQDMSLQGGEYLLSLGCTGYYENEFTVYHRLYDICSITVISDKDTVGYFDMDSTVTVE
ncbi:ABC transporter ATP-binding protein [Anaerosporobacter sp.]